MTTVAESLVKTLAVAGVKRKSRHMGSACLCLRLCLADEAAK